MWGIVSDSIDDKLKKFRSNKPLLNNFQTFVKDVKLLNDNDNPSKLGNRNVEDIEIVLEYILPNHIV